MKEFSRWLFIAASCLLFASSVFASDPSPPPVNLPTLNEWGKIFSAVAMGASGLYYLIKK
jgi:hypothetical protein